MCVCSSTESGFQLKALFKVIASLFSLSAGRPQPQVRWLINGLQVDDQYEHNSGDVIENRLLWPSVQRADLNSIFTCQALNTKLVEPKETSFVLDMNCEFAVVRPRRVDCRMLAFREVLWINMFGFIDSTF